MILKTLVFIFVLAAIAIITVLIAGRAVDKDIKDAKEKTEVKIGEEAWETINEAKRWIEEDNQKYGGDRMIKGLNKHTLGELLALEPTNKDYERYIEMVGEQVRKQYLDYQFFLYEPDKEDLVSGFLMQFQILGHEPAYEELFTYAMDTGLEMDKIDDYFYEALTAGEVIPVGDGIVLQREGTGISPIKSGDDVRVIISFVTEEYKKRQEEAEAEDDND